MTDRTTANPDDGFQTVADLARGCRHLADVLTMVQRARATSLAETSTERERADAFHVLLVHESSLRQQAMRLASAAERLAYGAPA